MPADVVPEQVQRRLDRDRVRATLSRSYAGVELARRSSRARPTSPVAKAPDLLLHLRADDVRVDADAADAAELEERLDEVVVAGVEVEAELDDVPRLVEVVVRLLDGAARSGSRRAARSSPARC